MKDSIYNFVAPDVDPWLSDVVMRSVARVVGVTRGEMFEKTRKRTTVVARRIYFYVMVMSFQYSPSALERFHVGGSGTQLCNISHHVKVCKEERELYPSIDKMVIDVNKLINDELIPLGIIKEKKGKSWMITRKNHRHQSFITMRLGSRM